MLQTLYSWKSYLQHPEYHGLSFPKCYTGSHLLRTFLCGKVEVYDSRIVITEIPYTTTAEDIMDEIEKELVPTATPPLELTRMLGNLTGNIVGSFSVES